MFKSLLATATLVASVAAHATFQELWINGVDYGSACVRLPQSNSPVTSPTSNNVACNVSPSSSPNLCPVNPGDTVTVEMHQQPGDRTCSNQAIGGDHFGPINIYLAKVSNALNDPGYDASWFKISEMGLLSDNPDYWATEVLNDNCGHYTFKIPSGIAPGNYLLRAEVIALHVASSVGGAQFYMSCYQLSIGGSGSTTPAGVSLPGAYSQNDPGILINIHTQLNSYVIPGPTPYLQSSPTVAATAYPTTATWNTASQPKTVPTALPGGASSPTGSSGSGGSSSSGGSGASSSSSAPASVSTGGTVAEYAQCGGIGWTGATACQSGLTCVQVNSYYYQCQQK